MAPRDPNKPSFLSPPADHGHPQTSSSRPTPQSLPTSSPSTSTSTADTGVNFHRSLPSVTLPTSGGAIRKIDEKFQVNPASGSCALTVPIPVSNARSASATPSLTLDYNSGGGNGPFGLGWGINPVPHITRKTDKGIPRYSDEFDTFIFSGSEDLVPRLTEGTQPTISEVVRGGYTVRQYLPRIENGFSRIERFTNTSLSEPDDVYWRVLTADNHCFIFGKDHTSRISDSEKQGRIYSWLLCQSYDCYGNVILYTYKAENRIGVPTLPSERNRSDETCARNRYLKSIKYGNRVSKYRQGWEDVPNPWMFELVLDYGEHDLSFPSTAEGVDWACRKDPFSSYRAGFEIRTYRLCRRILMFHHLPEDLGGVTDYLVFSTNLEYEQNPVASLLKEVTGIGYLLQARQYSIESMPTLSLDYSKSPALDELVVQDSDAPFDLAGNAYEWIDLDSEGLPGVLCEQAGSWFYRRNLSANNSIDSASTPVPRFGPLELVDPRPAPSLQSRTTRLADLDATGEVDLVDDSVRGFYERTTADGWTNFRPFSSWPNVDLSQPGVRFVDLTGDGMADIMVTEDEAFSWYRSRGKEGYEAGRRIFQSYDEEKGPKVVWTDPESAETIYLSDFSGDGLLDLVRIRNGDICYWPSLGYGLFGDKVTMDNAPWFDSIDQFTHDRLHLTDIDGSGTMDLLYLLASGGANVYRNQAGNGWSDADPLQSFPQIDSISTVSTIDLLGTGCACLVWTRPSDHTRLRYIDLVGGRKPFLLTWHANGLGLETKVSYTPSTRFYLDAQENGKPWVTRLPFPVQCVEKTEAFDNVSRSYFATRYAYHHGFYDRVEREFRGFGMVEQWDAEEYNSKVYFPNARNMEKAYVIAPVHTKTWFHTGAVMASPAPVAHQFAAGYFESKPLLEDSLLPVKLTSEEYQQAFRSLKGSILRTEIYLDDGSSLSSIPVRVEENGYTVDLKQSSQPKIFARHAVFLVKSQETVTVSHEREMHDPRVTQTINLDFDDYRNVLKSVKISYGRRPSSDKLHGISVASQKAVKAIQQELQVVYSDHQYTNAIDDVDAHRNPELCGTGDYHITGLSRADKSRTFRLGDFTVDDSNIFAEAKEVNFEDIPTPSVLAKRLVSSSFKVFRSDDLQRTLPKGEFQVLALPGESFQLALTPGLIGKIYQRIDEDGKPVLLDVDMSQRLCKDGGYVLLDGKLWIPSGTLGFSSPSSSSSSLPTPELFEQARDHFFTFKSFRNTFGERFIEFDSHDLLPVREIDAVGNTKAAYNNYVHLLPEGASDINGNRTQVLRSPLGEVVASAVMGKEEQDGQVPVGDSLTGLNWSPSDAQKDRFLSDPESEMADLLGDASTRTIFIPQYSPKTSIPFAKATISRATHAADEIPTGDLLVQFAYYDGLGRQIQATELAKDVNASSPGNWRVSGWTVLNNKGHPVKQYEPFFHLTHKFQNEAKQGTSAITTFYDPLGRSVGSLSEDHTWTKVVYGSWQRMIYDASDNVLQRDPREDPHVGRFFKDLWGDGPPPQTWYSARTELPSADPLEREAAMKSAAHNDTATVVHLDNLGRDFVTVLHNVRDGVHEFYASRNVFDIKGNIHRTIDAQDRDVARTDFDMCGRELHRSTMDFGEEWWIHDITGNTLVRWQDDNIRIRTTYDQSRRPVGRYAMNPGSPDQNETQFERLQYGEAFAYANTQNLRGKLHKLYDRSGLVVSQYDFKGNLVRTDRRFLVDYKSEINWAKHQDDDLPCLGPAVATKTTSFDALNRVTELAFFDTPEGPLRRIRYVYNRLSLLSSSDTMLPPTATIPKPVWDPVVVSTNYDALGRKTTISYSNKTTTKYEYDPVDLSLRRVHTVRGTNTALQDLKYTYDAQQNITHIDDKAQQDIYFRNTRVTPGRDFTYDAVNRLTQASGREAPGSPVILNQRGRSEVSSYTEMYTYDSTGNILSVRHDSSDKQAAGWTRRYIYAQRSPLQSKKFCNRLNCTMVGKVSENYTYDTHGNLTSRPGVQVLEWDFQNELRMTSRHRTTGDVRGRTYYAYDAAGTRVRKTTDRQPISRKPLRETLYLGGYEVFRKFHESGKLQVERLTLSVGEEPVCRVETELIPPAGTLSLVFRFQLLDHIGSVSAELDIVGLILTYFEYSAFGKPLYSARANSDLVPRPYRFSGKERDDETELYYFGARYYDAELGRWTAPDPIGLHGGLNVYCYVLCNPVVFVDPDGRMPVTARQAARNAETAAAHQLELIAFKQLDIPLAGNGKEKVYNNMGDQHFFYSPRLEGIWNNLQPTDLVVLNRMLGHANNIIAHRRTASSYTRDGGDSGHAHRETLWENMADRITTAIAAITTLVPLAPLTRDYMGRRLDPNSPHPPVVLPPPVVIPGPAAAVHGNAQGSSAVTKPRGWGPTPKITFPTEFIGQASTKK